MSENSKSNNAVSPVRSTENAIRKNEIAGVAKRSAVITGVVVSDKMSKTIVVRIDRVTRHPIYRKVMKRSRKIKAHDEKNVAKTGDVVKIIETRPLSKDKRWKLVEVIEKGS